MTDNNTLHMERVNSAKEIKSQGQTERGQRAESGDEERRRQHLPSTPQRLPPRFPHLPSPRSLPLPHHHLRFGAACLPSLRHCSLSLSLSLSQERQGRLLELRSIFLTGRCLSDAMTRLEVHEEEAEDDDGEGGESDESGFEGKLMSSILMEQEEGWRARSVRRCWRRQLSVFDVVVAALRKSLVTCSVDPREDVCSPMDIGWPTDVRHIAHVTFDRFQGFLGLPVELEHDVLRRAPSASASVFGVSAESMQCSFDSRGNSVPTILLLMQQHLYSQGGLHAEGIFRINAENGQEVYVRDQLNKGVIPDGVDLHCLAGLIKAWFRELPSGILDSITPDQVMHCNSEEGCSQLVSILPATEAALLDWAINLMADVVQYEHYNKMNARNIAMVFAPNMTQMADPLTALIHAVQVMNFLKMLIVKKLRERAETATEDVMLSCSSCSRSPSDKDEGYMLTENFKVCEGSPGKPVDICVSGKGTPGKPISNDECGPASGDVVRFWSFEKEGTTADHLELIDEKSLPAGRNKGNAEKYKGDYCHGDVRIKDRLNFRNGVKKLCRHPVFLLTKSVKRSRDQAIVNSAIEGREAWA